MHSTIVDRRRGGWGGGVRTAPMDVGCPSWRPFIVGGTLHRRLIEGGRQAGAFSQVREHCADPVGIGVLCTAPIPDGCLRYAPLMYERRLGRCPS